MSTIKRIAKDIKKLNIVTENIAQFKKVVDYLYNGIGILINVSNNLKINLKSSDVIVNIDFSEELLNKLNIPSNAVILNIPSNINIRTKKFTGINIKSLEINIPDNYMLEGFSNISLYEAKIYEKKYMQVEEQIQKDKINVKYLIGVNGIINKNDFFYLTKYIL